METLKKKVLLIEPNYLVRQSIADTLQLLPVQVAVYSFENAGTAVEVLLEHTIQLIVAKYQIYEKNNRLTYQTKHAVPPFKEGKLPRIIRYTVTPEESLSFSSIDNTPELCVILEIGKNIEIFMRAAEKALEVPPNARLPGLGKKFQ